MTEVFFGAKVHGEQSSTYTRYSVGAIWAQGWEGSYHGDIQAQYLAERKVHITHQTSTLDMHLHIRTCDNEVLFRIGPQVSGYEGGLVNFKGLTVSLAGASFTWQNIFDDENVSRPGYTLTGPCVVNDIDRTTFFLGNNVYADPEGALTVETLKIASPNPPASASASGEAGQIEWDGSYIYVCTATDTWVRAALSTW